MNIFCNLVGHRWLYKSYDNSIKPDGSKYLYSATRMCKRCSAHEYKYEDWVTKEFLLPEDRVESFILKQKNPS